MDFFLATLVFTFDENGLESSHENLLGQQRSKKINRFSVYPHYIRFELKFTRFNAILKGGDMNSMHFSYQRAISVGRLETNRRVCSR